MVSEPLMLPGGAGRVRLWAARVLLAAGALGATWGLVRLGLALATAVLLVGGGLLAWAWRSGQAPGVVIVLALLVGALGARTELGAGLFEAVERAARESRPAVERARQGAGRAVEGATAGFTPPSVPFPGR